MRGKEKKSRNFSYKQEYAPEKKETKTVLLAE
jgi:hypothetical protein